MNDRWDDAVSSLGVPVEIVPGLSAFGYEHTPSNSYRFVWTDAAINRDTNTLVTASIELFRDGDVCVTTNGVAAHLPRELPFDHRGYGQDDEWVAANFTNATEILAVGYPQWVDVQVGMGLTNGLYKLTVNVADDPPETTQISVGNLSIAVTNAGEYVFLLKKCTDYPISVFPETATNFVYSAVDDIAPRPLMFGMAGINDGWWTTDRQGLKLVPPMYPMTLFTPRSHVLWIPTLQVSPSTWQPSSLSDTETFRGRCLKKTPVATFQTARFTGSTITITARAERYGRRALLPLRSHGHAGIQFTTKRRREHAHNYNPGVGGRNGDGGCFRGWRGATFGR